MRVRYALGSRHSARVGVSLVVVGGAHARSLGRRPPKGAPSRECPPPVSHTHLHAAQRPPGGHAFDAPRASVCFGAASERERGACCAQAHTLCSAPTQRSCCVPPTPRFRRAESGLRRVASRFLPPEGSSRAARGLGGSQTRFGAVALLRVSSRRGCVERAGESRDDRVSTYSASRKRC